VLGTGGLALAGLALAGCTGDTGIELTLTTDLQPGVELESVNVSVASTALPRMVVLEETIAASLLPFTLAIEPKGGDAGREVSILVDAIPGPELRYRIPTTSMEEGFEPGEVREITLNVSPRCSLREGRPFPDGCGAPCLGTDTCEAGFACTESGCRPMACGDSCVAGPCQEAGCEAERCVITNRCSASEECCAGACVVAACDDANPCTTDRCDDAVGCTHLSDGRVCM
jgi:hypothetical protein